MHKLPQQPDIVILVVDSLSRDHARRMLPSLQKELTQQFGAVVFQSHSVAGWKSIENDMVLLRGCYAVPSHAVADLMDSAPASITLTKVEDAKTHREYETLCSTQHTGEEGWLFHTLRAQGYQTMHASQICTRGSRYSTEVFYNESSAWDKRYDSCDGREYKLPEADVLAHMAKFVREDRKAGASICTCRTFNPPRIHKIKRRVV